jgi:polysaccharide biosynthesis protein PslG
MTRKPLPIFLLVLAAIWPAAARGYLPPGFIGISPQSAASARDFDLMREAGVRSVRLPLNWSVVQEQAPSLGEADWDGFDHEVKVAAEAGIRVMPFVWGTPEWAAPQVVDLPVRSAWQRWGWSKLLREAARRYGPDGYFWEDNPDLPFLPIRRWEIWNEQNIVTFADPVDPVAFARLIRISGRVLHRVDPGAKVIVGGFFGRPLQIPPNVASGDFLSRLYRVRDVKRHFDGIALHPYVARARAMGAQIENLRRIMRNHGDARTPIYVTELGWGSRSGPTRWERGLYGQARQLSQAFALLSANRLRWRIGGAWWFTWTDEGGSCGFCRSAGLLTEKRRAKPAWYRFNAWTGGDPDAVERGLFGPFGEELEPADETEGGGSAEGGDEATSPAPEPRRQ